MFSPASSCSSRAVLRSLEFLCSLAFSSSTHTARSRSAMSSSRVSGALTVQCIECIVPLLPCPPKRDCLLVAGLRGVNGPPVGRHSSRRSLESSLSLELSGCGYGYRLGVTLRRLSVFRCRGTELSSSAPPGRQPRGVVFPSPDERRSRPHQCAP